LQLKRPREVEYVIEFKQGWALVFYQSLCCNLHKHFLYIYTYTYIREGAPWFSEARCGGTAGTCPGPALPSCSPLAVADKAACFACFVPLPRRLGRLLHSSFCSIHPQSIHHSARLSLLDSSCRGSLACLSLLIGRASPPPADLNAALPCSPSAARIAAPRTQEQVPLFFFPPFD
jgi:hypothetical protein